MTTDEKTKIHDVKTALQRQLDDIKALQGINSLLLSVCLVDTLAGFYCGYSGEIKGNKDRFEKFADKYLNIHKPHIYNLRCNLAHSFSNTVANYMFVDSAEFTRVFGKDLVTFGSPIFSIDSFKTDLEKAFNSYFTDLANEVESNLLSNFLLRFNSFGILQDHTIPTVSDTKGNLLRNINDAENLPELDIKRVMYKPTKIKK